MDSRPSSLDLSHPLSRELYFLVAKFLDGGPCVRAAQALHEELEEHESAKVDHVGPDHLLKILDIFLRSVNDDAKNANSSCCAKSLLSSKIFQSFRNESEKRHTIKDVLARRRGWPIIPRRIRDTSINPVASLFGREVSGAGVDIGFLKSNYYTEDKFRLACRTLGHLSAVYCVLFDVSGKYIFTGADDHLVKIWSALDGRLLSTLRGSPAEITDLAVNNENTLLAVGNCEKFIQVWCLGTCAPVATLNVKGNVTSIFFCPIPQSRLQFHYLAATTSDGACVFWAYGENQEGLVQFQPKPTVFAERMRPGHAQMICASFSPGGAFMAAGNADNNVRVYYMLGSEGPERILEVEVHRDAVDSISWAHKGLRLISGSKDGTALVWRYENAHWRYTRLNCTRDPGEPAVVPDDPRRRPRVTMVAWTLDDSMVLTAVSDSTVKVWNSVTGELVRILRDHQDDSYVIEPHPLNPRIICTAGHDGRIIIWDIGLVNEGTINSGINLFEFCNELPQGQGNGAVFDCKWSPDGMSIAATDSHGHLLIFNYGEACRQKFQKLPREMFFHTDYRPISRDAITNEVMDEQTQVPPHLMPPPFLVDVDGNPYPPHLQRLVPGRENCREEQLVPNVAIAAGGQQEVIEGIPAALANNANANVNENANVNANADANADVNVQPQAPGANIPRSNIDQMIEQLAIEQGVARNEGNRLSNGGERERRGVGLLQSGDVEGVRQSRGDWHGRDRQMFSCNQRKYKAVPPLTSGLLSASEDFRNGHFDYEDCYYQLHRQCIPIMNVLQSPQGRAAAPLVSPTDSLNSDRQRRQRGRRLALAAAESRIRLQQSLDEEGVAMPNPPQMEISVPQEISIRQRARPLPPRARSRPNRLPASPLRPANRRRVRYDVRRLINEDGQLRSDPSEEEASSSDDSEMSSSSSSSSSDSDEDMDWEHSTSTRRDGPSTSKATVSTRKRPTRRQPGSPPQNGVKKEPSSDDDDEPQPGPSSAMKSKEPKMNKPRKARRPPVVDAAGLEEIPENFRPSEWLSEVVPKMSPYFPQIGDELVYFRQGHEMYIEEVKKKRFYDFNKKMHKSLPWISHPQLKAEEFVKVITVKFELLPPRLVCLKLQRIDLESGEANGLSFTVKYHDLDGVTDFLVLRQMYDKSVRQNWNEGNRFRCLIDKHWWLGVVTKCEPHNSKFPDSKFMCYKTKWDSGEVEAMSPWDMEMIPDNFSIPPDTRKGIPASSADISNGAYEYYECEQRDWNGHQDIERTRISQQLSQLFDMSIAEPFLYPVDLVKYPSYAEVIEYPVDLSMIKTRLDNRFYRRVQAFQFDISYISMNAAKFNQTSSDIVRSANVIKELCTEIGNHDVDVVQRSHALLDAHKRKQADETKTVRSKSKPSGNQPSTSAAARNQPCSSKSLLPKLKTNETRSPSKYETRQGSSWQKQCLELLSDMVKLNDAEPFKVPVDIIEYPDYYSCIDTPMDLQNIAEDLRGNNYESLAVFNKDMRLIFSNSKQYNTNKKSKIYTMTVRLQSWYEAQFSKRFGSGKSKFTSSPVKSSTRIAGGSGTRTNVGTGGAPKLSPRKNPSRAAASRNPYLGNGDYDDSEDDDYIDNARGSKSNRPSAATSYQKNLRNRGQPNGHAHVEVNGHRSPRRNSDGSVAGPSRSRIVKRRRISSGESGEAGPSTSSQAKKRQKLTHLKNTRTNVAGQGYAVEDRSEEEDEFEDGSDDGIPDLHGSDSVDSDDDGLSNLRRSSRVKKTVRRSEGEGNARETRYGGRRSTNYYENSNLSEEESGVSRQRGAGSPRRGASSPQRSSRRGRIVNYDEENEDEDESDENEGEDNNDEEYVEDGDENEPPEDDDESEQAGPSSRISSRRSSSRTSGVLKSSVKNEEDSDSEGEVVNTRRRTKGPQRAKHQVSSDDDDDAGRKASSRATRGRNRPNYREEDSDSEPGPGPPVSDVSVSQRGRIRKTRPL